MTAMTLSANRLKLKFITKKPEVSSGDVVTPPLSKDVKGISACGNGNNELGNLKKCTIKIPNGDRKHSQLKSNIGVKRGPEEAVDLPIKKKLKMDRSLHRKCTVILKKLMAHKDSWAFSKPVDPVALQIPDYFSVITKPMDLGTVKCKLEGGFYSAAEEFEADVRLTFSNAMHYNPPQNRFHQMAKELNALFSNQWRFTVSFLDKQHMSNDEEKTLDVVENGCSQIAPARSEALNRNPNDSKSSKDVSSNKVSGGDMKIVKKHNVKISKASKLTSSQPVSPSTKRSVRVESDSANPTHVSNLHKGSSQSAGRIKPKQIKEAFSGKRMPLIDMKVPEKSVDEVVHKFKPQMSRSDHDSDGAISCLDEEHANATVTSVCTPTVSEEWRSSIDETQLSPDKAMRAAMLKQRFADTILKAQQQTTHRPGDIFNSVKLDEEKKRLERRQQEEKLKIEAQIKASQYRQESERRMQRERVREAARKSLEKMERSVMFDDNIRALDELAQIMRDFSFAGPLGGHGGMYAASNQFSKGKLKNPLESLGLFLKEEEDLLVLEDDLGNDRDDTPSMDFEEGELIS